MCKLSEGASYEKIPFPEERKAIDVGDFVCDYKAFQSTFDWDPKVNFQEGISKSIDYYRKIWIITFEARTPHDSFQRSIRLLSIA